VQVNQHVSAPRGGQTWGFLRDGTRYGRRFLRRRLKSETMASADPGIWGMSDE